jgi:catechol 2,3-dioxygenase-like lactoylglutathione lyase family enzyme
VKTHRADDSAGFPCVKVGHCQALKTKKAPRFYRGGCSMDSAMNLQKIDHLVLAVADIERSCHFYGGVMGMRRVTFGENRTALHFGESKINLHPIGWDYYLKAGNPNTGSADLCFIVDEDVWLLKTSLMGLGVEVIDGPIARTGAIGDLLSIYVRDPDGNLIELANQTSESGK